MFLRRRRIAIFLIGDILLFYLALVFMVTLRFPSGDRLGVFFEHLTPFSYLTAVWVLIFFIAGLYDKKTLFFRRQLPSLLFNTQLVNIFIGVLFFYLIPSFKIAPKTNLFFYLLISFSLILLWRLYGVTLFPSGKKQKALFIGQENNFNELVGEINRNEDYGIEIVRPIDLKSIELASSLHVIAEEIPTRGVFLVVIDMHNPAIEIVLPKLYNLLFSGIRFFDMHKVYEEVFQKIPLSLIDYRWFLENVSFSSRGIFDFFKRVVDILIGFVLGVLSLIIYPFVIFAIKIDDGGNIFVLQRRVGKNNQIIKVLKFRTMEFDDEGRWEIGKINRVTRVGEFLRKTRIDELPQLWNILGGSISLIGPRPEFPDAVAYYSREIAYYNIRHLIKPGLSGWAQILHENHPHHGTNTEETAVKLSYDLYYIKNRSLALDLEIALKTIKIILSRKGI